MSKSWAGGSTRAWRTLRAAVLARDAGKGCRAHRDGWCARKPAKEHVCTGTQDCAHHTLGREVTGDDPLHVVASCKACNLAIGEPSTAARDPRPRTWSDW